MQSGWFRKSLDVCGHVVGIVAPSMCAVSGMLAQRGVAAALVDPRRWIYLVSLIVIVLHVESRVCVVFFRTSTVAHGDGTFGI